MLPDTLALDIGKALASAKATADQMQLLEIQSASLSAVDTPEARGLIGKIWPPFQKVTLLPLARSRLRQLLNSKKNVCGSQPPPNARPCVALQELGYEVGMACAPVYLRTEE